MAEFTRRALIGAGLSGSALAALPSPIARAAAIAPDVRTGTIQDVQHVVILMQENRGFDHYFGTLRGVRGFADRFPIPVAIQPRETGRRTVWQQRDRTAAGGERPVLPFHLATRNNFDLMRMEGTPHSWTDAQAAWDDGRMTHWPEAKSQRAMGYFQREDLPFQFALAEAFTICDAYHCSVQTGTNTNRLFLWTGTNDPAGTQGGPSIDNSHDSLPEKGGAKESYRWITTVERLQASGIDWRIYQDMADNFTDNPLVGFAAFRDAHRGAGNAQLRDRALTTRGLDKLRDDVLTGRLPQVSYIIATAKGSEHPGPSSPAQGAAYTAEVIDALTADPAIWARTALLVMFDENDGFFDHVPPPAPPSRAADGALCGDSTVDLTGEYHLRPNTGDQKLERPAWHGRAYGLGPRVPMYVVSPWSRGGWVNSQTFDHTSVIRFLEARFGIHEPNISPWRRAVCGDLTSAFDFAATDPRPFARLPDTRPNSVRAAAIPHQISPLAPADQMLPRQEPGIRRARALPYRLEARGTVDGRGIHLRFDVAIGTQAAVFHVYDAAALSAPPRRFTVDVGNTIADHWPFDSAGRYDLWVLGPNGFHRHFIGRRDDPASLAAIDWTISPDEVALSLPAEGVTIERRRAGRSALVMNVTGPRYRWSIQKDHGWYDATLTSPDSPMFCRRLSGRSDRPGRPTCSDPFV